MLPSIFTLSTFIAFALAKSYTTEGSTGQPCEIVVFGDNAYKSKCQDESIATRTEKGMVHKSGNLFFCNIDKGKSDWMVECGRTCDKSYMDCDYMCRHKSASFWTGSFKTSYYLTAKCWKGASWFFFSFVSLISWFLLFNKERNASFICPWYVGSRNQKVKNTIAVSEGNQDRLYSIIASQCIYHSCGSCRGVLPNRRAVVLRVSMRPFQPWIHRPKPSFVHSANVQQNVNDRLDAWAMWTLYASVKKRRLKFVAICANSIRTLRYTTHRMPFMTTQACL